MFDTRFDDAVWSLDWLDTPLLLPLPAVHPRGWQVRDTTVHDAVVFGRSVRLPRAIDVRLLFDPEGRLWMSTLPQELAMMHEAARRAVGRVLVGGLGLAVYPQYAQAVGAAEEIVVVERSPAVAALVEPTLLRSARVPIRVVAGDVVEYLAGPGGERFDTVYLDVWETIDPARIPEVNYLGGLAERHLAPSGRVYAWGYRWMQRMFEDAARALVAVESTRRWGWLGRQCVPARRLLAPLLVELDEAGEADEAAELARCRAYAERVGRPVGQGSVAGVPRGLATQRG